jgi:GNAT superfamily N-acetyltransferase
MTVGDQRLSSGFNKITVQDDPRALLPLLKSQLPHSIPLLRRLQHNLAFPSETARLLTTFPGVEPPSGPWLAAYVDLPRGRETQMTLYSSLERESVDDDKDPAVISTLHGPPETLALARAQLLALLSYTKSALLPGYLASLTAPSVDPGPPNAPGQMPPPPPQAFLIGNLHTGLMALLKKSGIYTDPETVSGIRIHRYDNPPYVKYLFQGAHTHSGGLDAGLPAGYRLEDRQGRTGVLQHHYSLVRSRTHLPRSDETLSRIPGVAVYVDRPTEGEEKPIAWVFLGLDGSLATLFVEPEHRGKGIAEAISRELMRRGMVEGGIWREVGDEGEMWVHANVPATNGASRRVLEKLGGEVAWTNTWTVVELQS